MCLGDMSVRSLAPPKAFAPRSSLVTLHDRSMIVSVGEPRRLHWRGRRKTVLANSRRRGSIYISTFCN
jgi:hypothetical protein